MAYSWCAGKFRHTSNSCSGLAHFQFCWQTAFASTFPEKVARNLAQHPQKQTNNFLFYIPLGFRWRLHHLLSPSMEDTDHTEVHAMRFLTRVPPKKAQIYEHHKRKAPQSFIISAQPNHNPSPKLRCRNGGFERCVRSHCHFEGAFMGSQVCLGRARNTKRLNSNS